MRSIMIALFAACISFAAGAQPLTPDTTAVRRGGLRISLLTCGVGDEVYETFGHTAVRVTDSSAEPPFNDLVYNYGMFNGFDKDFELKFMRGKLKYYVATNYFGDFMEEYYEYGRSVQEQELVMPQDKKQEIKAYLENNTLPSNRYYKYDFFFDNCATRIRDVFPHALGGGFKFGDALKADRGITFRDIINRYFYRRHWERVGVNILLGSRIDKVMTNEDIMFLPDYLRTGVGEATLSGERFSTPPVALLQGREAKPSGVNMPMVLMCTLLVLMVAGHSVKKLRWLGRVMNALALTVSGLLGVLIVLMWFGTDHQGCGNNYNILWALPVNLVIAFARPRGRGTYAVIAMALVVVSLFVHVLGIQGLVPELIVFMAMLMVAYVSIYRNSRAGTGKAAQPPSMYYRRMGSGPAIVLLHGFPDSGEIWGDIATKLATKFTVIIPDLPGAGQSPLAGTPSLAEMAVGIKDILDREGIGPVVMAGHSMGGYTAMAFATQFPRRLAGLGMVHSSASPDTDDKKANRQRIIDLLAKGGKETFVKQMTVNLFSPAFARANTGVLERKAETSMQMSAGAMSNFYKAMMERPGTAETLKKASYPVMWVHGQHDTIIDFRNFLKECHLSGINFVSLYKDSGHMSMIEQPVELTTDLGRFASYCFSRNP